MARTPRGEVVDSDEVGCVHIVQRCVRKSFLCGVDQATGKNYEHRKKLNTKLNTGATQFRLLNLDFRCCEIPQPYKSANESTA